MVQEAIAQGDINTNYAQSWFGARGTAKITVGATGAVPAVGQKTLAGGFDGLSVRVAEKGKVPSSAIAMLGDASPGDASEAIANGSFTPDVPLGSRLAESFVDGPSFISASGNI